MAENNIYIDKDLLITPFFSTRRSFSIFKRFKKYRDFMDKPKSIPELFALNQLCYFMVRNAVISEKRLTRSEREKYILPLSEQWANRVFIEGEYDLPIWISNMFEDFKDGFGKTSAYEKLTGLELDIQYTKIPTLRIDNTGRLVMNVALMPFLMQINYSYLFFMKIDDYETHINEIRQKMLPLLVFQSNPVSTSISGLPVMYGLNKSEVELAKQLSMSQIYYMILHEIGHIENNHIPGKQPDIKINSAEGPKEIEADIYAYSILETIKGERGIETAASIVTLLSFYLLAEELKNKLRNTNESASSTVFRDRLHLAKINMRQAVDKYGPNTINKTSFDAVEEAAINYMMYALHPLGVMQQTIQDLSVNELQDFCEKCTAEGITKHLEEDKDAAANN